MKTKIHLLHSLRYYKWTKGAFTDRFNCVYTLSRWCEAAAEKAHFPSKHNKRQEHELLS